MASLPTEAEELLGVIPDTQIAQQFGVPAYRVRYARHSKGIPPVKGQGRPSKKTPELRAALGTAIDVEIAERFDVSVGMVCKWRKDLGIPAFQGRGRPRIKRTPEARRAFLNQNYPGLFEKLGRVTDYALAEEYGISRERIRQFRGFFDIPSYTEQASENFEEVVVPLLGTMPDSEIAALFGLNMTALGKARRERGIKTYSNGYRELMEANRHRMGKESDNQIARDLDVRPQTVTRWRKKFGIEPFQESPRLGFNKIPRDEVERLFHEGKKDIEIAEALGSTRATIGQIRRQLGLVRRRKSGKKYKTGPRPHTRTIDYDHVRILFEEGWTDVAISEALQCNAETIRGIRRRLGLERP